MSVLEIKNLHVNVETDQGIREDEARRLVVRGFLTEIVQKIGSPELEERLIAAIEAELEGR